MSLSGPHGWCFSNRGFFPRPRPTVNSKCELIVATPARTRRSKAAVTVSAVWRSMPNNGVSLCMVIHSHQPVGNLDHVIEEAYQKSYLPFLEVLSRHPRIRMSLHYSGVLWEWIEAR